ncbi:hypothetical protein TSOC_009104 [Tetrabaena socialis]|uniref:F-box domain-containing protein n=1 Tax=Tetrabaena socialis TaxID=47790 RepID=A0A2J7ZWN9_9CHLO|nr:hypothetical protein TSOC_009104 [Tetrabaena socialis]|eukprot:PNH04701.1 hypothetical protein TSOC_009104 [Tetrabaena socialis]
MASGSEVLPALTGNAGEMDANVDVDVMRAPELLALLPASVLLNNVLAHLSAADAVRLGSCSRALRLVAFADEVWRGRCEDRGWGPFARGVSWQGGISEGAGFSATRSSLCVECLRPSRYVFALLSCRLCEACEHRSPRYGLVTALEAAERYGVPYDKLEGLPYHDACRTRFFMRAAVEELAAAGSVGQGRKGRGQGHQQGLSAAAEAGDGAEGSSGEEPGSAEEGEAEEQRQQQRGSRPGRPLGGSAAGSEGSDMEEGCEKPHGDHPEEEEGGGMASGGSDEDDAPVTHGRRAADKAARKAAKKAEAQRDKRQQRNAAAGAGGSRERPSYGRIAFACSPPSGGAGAMALGRRAAQQQLLLQPGGGRRARRAMAAAGSSPPGCRAAGPLLAAAGDGGDGPALPLEGQAVPLRRSRAGGARGAAVAGGRIKLKSGWAAEREALMAEWGAFGISGLVLAS